MSNKTVLVDQPTAAPTRKLTATGIGGIVAIGILAALDAWMPGIGQYLSEPVYAAVALVSGLISGYFTRNAKE